MDKLIYFHLRFLKSFHLTQVEKFFSGPFRDVNAESVNDELGEMFRVMHKLTKIFVDPGPRTVAEKFRSKIEKFKVNLPLLNVISNPGLRDRHWESVSDCSLVIIIN